MNKFDEYLSKHKFLDMDYLRENIPEIKRLEDFEDFQDVELIEGNHILDDFVMLRYDVKAPELFPYVRQRLLDKGLVKKNNIKGTRIKNKDCPEEKYNIHIGFYGAKLQISLDVHK